MAEYTQSEIRHAEQIAEWGNRAIWVAASILAALFAFLQLSEIPYSSAINGTNPQYAREIILSLYYVSWVFGASSDISIMRYSYTIDPKKGQLTAPIVMAFGGFLIIAIVLLWVKDSDAKFAAALAVFFIANVLGWRVIVHRTASMAAGSGQRIKDTRELIALEELNRVKTYMTGSWQWWRFLVLALIVCLVLSVSFLPTIRDMLSDALHTIMPTVSLKDFSEILPVLTFFVFVVVSDVWMWIVRLQAKVTLRTLDSLRTEYILARKNNAD